MNAYIVYTNEKNDDELALHKNVKKLNAKLFFETVMKIPYTNDTKNKLMLKVLKPEGLTISEDNI